MSLRRVLSSLPLLCLAVLAAPAWAQTAASPVTQLPAVAVHERRTDAAGAASTVTTADLLPGATAVELGRFTPGLALNSAGALGFGQTTTLRGLGNTPFFGDASAPVYLDDIPLLSGFTFTGGLFDFARVDVLRGPQAATQSGRAGDGGVIRLGTAEPGATARGQVELTAGSHGAFAATLAAATARTEFADATVFAGTSRRDGYIRNTQLNTDVDSRESESARARVRYRPAPGWELSLHVLGQRSRDGAQALVPLGGPLFEVRRGKEGVCATDFAALAGGLSREFARGRLTATSSWTHWELAPYSNRLVVFGGANFDSALSQSQRTFSEEIRFEGDRLTAGAFFSRSATAGDTDRVFRGFPIERSAFDVRGDTLALFARHRIDAAGGWQIIPGLRWEQTDKEFVRRETVPVARTLRRDGAWRQFLPSLLATKKLDAATDLTLTVARGYKPGGFSAYTAVAALARFDAQRTDAIEVAVDHRDAGGRWQVTARGYAYRVRGYQIERSFAVPGSFTDEYLVANAPRARVLGGELESTWRLHDGLTLRGTAGFTAATLTRFTDPFTGANYSGSRAPYVPTGNAALQLAYRRGPGWFGHAAIAWTGPTHYDERETAAFTQPGYALAEAALGYAFARGEISLYGRNLADRGYLSSVTPGIGHGTPGDPRTWGVSARWHW